MHRGHAPRRIRRRAAHHYVHIVGLKSCFWDGQRHLGRDAIKHIRAAIPPLGQDVIAVLRLHFDLVDPIGGEARPRWAPARGGLCSRDRCRRCDPPRCSTILAHHDMVSQDSRPASGGAGLPRPSGRGLPAKGRRIGEGSWRCGRWDTENTHICPRTYRGNEQCGQHRDCNCQWSGRQVSHARPSSISEVIQYGNNAP